MDIRDLFSGLLGSSVGNNIDNNSDDVLKTKSNLKNAGSMDNDEEELQSPFVTRKMDESIKAFQRANALKIDGIMKPGGETERGLFEALTSRSADEAFGSADNGDNDSIGFRGNILGMLRNQLSKTDNPAAKTSSAPARKRIATPDNPFGYDEDIIRLYSASSPSQTNTTVVKPEEKQSIPVPGRKPYDSPYRPPILDVVSNKEVKEEIGEHEGVAIPHMYKDSAKDGGKVTVGTGIMLPDAEAAKKLPFTVPDGKGNRRPATDKEIEAAFNKVEAIHNNNFAATAFEPNAGDQALAHNLDDLRLSTQDSDRILDRELRERAHYVKNRFKHRNIDMSKTPPSIKKLTLDIEYNTGSVSRGLLEAIKNRDWARARTETQQYKINEKRDAWRLEQIDKAIEWDKKHP